MPVALKIYNLSNSDQFKREAAFYDIVRQHGVFHPHIVNCIGLSSTSHIPGEETKPFIIQEVATFGTLLDNLHLITTQVQAIDIALQITYALWFMHTSLKVFHRDLKSENILVMSHWNVKLSDFGISCLHAGVKEQSLPAGTITHMSPQFLEQGSSHTYTASTEVYSLGVLFWELFCGRQQRVKAEGVYPGLQPVQVLYQVINDNARPVMPPIEDGLLDADLQLLI